MSTPTHINSQHNQHSQAAHRSVMISVYVNLFLAIGQVAVGLLSKSQSLVADGIHSLSDLISDFIVLLAGRHSRKGPDDNHPYGHRRFENAASLALGMLLFIVGAGMAWSAIIKFHDIHSIPTVHASALWVALVALACKELLFRYQLAAAKKANSSMLIANAWHARSDAASSLIVGIGIIGNLAGYPVMDPVAALIVGSVIGKMGAGFIWSAMHDLLDGAADAEEVEAIRLTLRNTEGIAGIHDLRTRKMGDLIMVDVHLEISGEISVTQGHSIAMQARENVLKHHPVLDVMTHLDPVPAPDSLATGRPMGYDRY